MILWVCWQMAELTNGQWCWWDVWLWRHPPPGGGEEAGGGGSRKGEQGTFFNTLQIQTTAIEIVIRLSGSSTPPHGSLLWRKSTRRFSIFSKLSFSFPSFLMFTLPLLAWWISQIIITIFCHYYDFLIWNHLLSKYLFWSQIIIFLKVEERAAARAEYKRSLQVQKEFEIRMGLLILILIFFRKPYFVGSQVMLLGSLVSELFLFLLYNLSFPKTIFGVFCYIHWILFRVFGVLGACIWSR